MPVCFVLTRFILLYLGEASKSVSTSRKSPGGSPQEISRKSCVSCYPTRSNQVCLGYVYQLDIN